MEIVGLHGFGYTLRLYTPAHALKVYFKPYQLYYLGLSSYVKTIVGFVQKRAKQGVF